MKKPLSRVIVKKSKVVFLIVVFVLFGSFVLFSQDYAKADSIALSLVRKKYKKTEDLVLDLTKDLTTNEEKYRAFFVYIAETFSYTYSNVNPKNALRVRKGNCSTIATLYKEMCDISNLKCEVVYGYIRDAHRMENIFVFFKGTTHAWNIIELNNQKVIVDATWGLAKTTGVSTSKIIDRGRGDFFFNPSPELFSLTHYPKKTKWLLTKKTKIQFVRQVGLYSEFRRMIDNVKFFPNKINQRKGKITFTFSDNLKDFDFRIEYEKTRLKPITIVKNNDNSFTVTFDISEIKRNTYFDLTYQELKEDEFFPIKPVLMYRKK
jgi:hypothetical protein